MLRTRLVGDRAGDEEPGGAALEALVCAAVEALGEHPRDDKLWRAVERTYVHPATTQERAAAALGLPFSTYRRHLTQGVDRVVAWLWDQEVYGGRRAALSTTGQLLVWQPGNLRAQPPPIEEVAAMDRQIGERAVVLGASMAGLLAAQVLADGYGQVTVIDRDELPEASMHRRGVPHGRHLHALAARGQQALEELFCGLTAELVADGVPAGDMLADTRLFFSGHRLRRAPTGLGLLCASRPVLEGRVRARVRALPNVRFVDRCDVVGLATTPDRRRVTGARLLRRADGSAEEVLGADLVVDATGRGTRTPAWLEALGYPRPPAAQVRVGLGYATRIYRLPPDALGGDLAVLQAATPRHPRAGALQLLEGDRGMVTLAGILGDHPPTDPGGFLDFARSLRFPDIYQAVRDAEPLDDPLAFRFPASVRHRYEKLDRFPTGCW